MEFLNLDLFIRIAAPMCMMFFILKDSARKNLLFMMIGMCVCLFCGEVSGLLHQCIQVSDAYFVSNITPVVEEIMKFCPVLFYMLVFKPERRKLLESAMAVGVGFAILENVFTLAFGTDDTAILLSLVRGFLTGMFHALSTLIVALGVSFLKKNRKILAAGTVTFLTLAITLHAICNRLVVSGYWYLSHLVTLLMLAAVVASMKFAPQT